MKKIVPEEVKSVSEYIYQVSGISLNQTKAYLMETRLGVLLEQFKCSSFRQLCLMAKGDKTKVIETKIISAISTNETLFFRDNSPFEMLKNKIIPDLIDNRTSKISNSLPARINIWSAACSTGQEIYSIAITLKELLHDIKKINIKLLGTDISSDVIKQASYGKYNKFEIERGLSSGILNKYFSSDGNSWKISDEIRSLASFRKINLMQSFSSLGKFDIIFCRNVAIYFTIEDRKKLFDRIADALAPGGYLLIGSTESLTGINARFEPKRHMRSVFYQLKG